MARSAEGGGDLELVPPLAKSLCSEQLQRLRQTDRIHTITITSTSFLLEQSAVLSEYEYAVPTHRVPPNPIQPVPKPGQLCVADT